MEYFKVTRDGEFLAGPFSDNLAFEWLLRYQSQSVEWAIEYEGYAIEPMEWDLVRAEDVFMGRTAEGRRVFIDMELSRHDGTGRKTTTHENPPAEYLRFSAMGLSTAKYKREPDTGGQCVMEELLEITEPAKGWTMDQIKRVHRLWKAWHLNDMTAHCRHMLPLPADPSYDARKHLTCPETGYKYGSAWLVAPLPATVVHEAQTLIRHAIETHRSQK